MDELSGLSDRDLDRLLAGDAPPIGEGSNDLEELLEALRAEYVEAVPERIEAAHLTTVVEAARRASWAEGNGKEAASATAVSAARKRRTRRRAALIALAVALGTPASATALAVAGVRLPDAVRAPFEAIGIELPNQEESAATIEGFDPPAIDLESAEPLRLNEPGVKRADRDGRDKRSASRDKDGGKTDDDAPSASAPSVQGGSTPSPTRGSAGDSGGSVPSTAGGGPPTTPPGNSGSNPFDGPPGITGEGPPGQTGAAPPRQGGR